MSLTSYQAAPPRDLKLVCRSCVGKQIRNHLCVAGKILVGTASWSDPGFVERWYPRKLPAGARLGWYAEHFEMVEVNSTFYGVPDERTVQRWSATTPNDFIFDVKLHQLFSFHSTAIKLLPPALQKGAEVDAKGKVNPSPKLQADLMRIFLGAISILKRDKKLGVFLLQLSPAFSPRKHELNELDRIIELLNGYQLAIEFRNRGWLVDAQLHSTREFLRERSIVFVNVDAPRSDHFTIVPSEVNEVTNANASYLRLHGRNAHAYLTGKTVAARFDYEYSEAEIQEVAARAEDLGRKANDVHVVFNNNNLDYAPRAALQLRKVLGQKPPPAQTGELF